MNALSILTSPFRCPYTVQPNLGQPWCCDGKAESMRTISRQRLEYVSRGGFLGIVIPRGGVILFVSCTRGSRDLMDVATDKQMR